MKIAVFTIARNESVFLPIWLSYYQRQFANDDIYVLDNDSDDGSTDNPPCNVKQVHSETCCDAPWLVRTVSEFQCELLEKYDWVLYAETDEIVYARDHGTISRVAVALGGDTAVLRCEGYEVIQNCKKEKTPLDLTMPILHQRSYWYRSTFFDKPILAREPVSWKIGFHQCGNAAVQVPSLKLIHLHRMDFDIAVERNAKRLNAQVNPESEKMRYGWQNRIGEKDMRANWNKTWGAIGIGHEIPTEYRSLI